jgi:hypothetical protein
VPRHDETSHSLASPYRRDNYRMCSLDGRWWDTVCLSVCVEREEREGREREKIEDFHDCCHMSLFSFFSFLSLSFSLSLFLFFSPSLHLPLSVTFLCRSCWICVLSSHPVLFFLFPSLSLSSSPTRLPATCTLYLYTISALFVSYMSYPLTVITTSLSVFPVSPSSLTLSSFSPPPLSTLDQRKRTTQSLKRQTKAKVRSKQSRKATPTVTLLWRPSLSFCFFHSLSPSLSLCLSFGSDPLVSVTAIESQ